MEGRGAEEVEIEGGLDTSRLVAKLVAASRSFTGFESPGKSLYVLIRETIENSLDAIEQAKVDDPKITISVKQDNGIGIKHGVIPKMFAELLYTTKSAHQQARGRLGMGVKNALIYSMDSTSEPVKVESEMIAEDYKSVYMLSMDPESGTAEIMKEDRVQKKDASSHGTRVEFTIVGNWSTHKKKILSYIHLTAMVTPYISFNFEYISKDPSKSMEESRARIVTQQPDAPKNAKYDPSSIFQKGGFLTVRSSSTTLAEFLTEEFANVDKQMATDFIGKLGPPFSTETKMEGLNYEQKKALKSGFEGYNFGEVNCECLVLLGEHFVAGIHRFLGHDILLGTSTSSPSAYEGHPYRVEAVITIGGKDAAGVGKGINFFRFANRTPLLYEEASDVIVQEAKNIMWDKYNIDHSEEKICIFVSFVSTEVPFTGLSKEAISGRQSIPTVIKMVLEGCCSDLQQQFQHEMRTRKKKRILDDVPVVAQYQINLIRGCAKMDDASTTEYNSDFMKQKFGSEDDEIQTRNEYEELLCGHVNK